MKLTDIRCVRQLMESNGSCFQKKFGQNFLINETIPPRIASYASPNVLEIGPGIGTLTRALSERAERVVSVEIDASLLPILDVTLADCPIVTVINADIMQVDVAQLAKTHFGEGEISVCANLPYNITTPVIMMLLRCGVPFRAITVMVQKEAADRFAARPGSPACGAVSSAVSYYARVEKLFNVSPGNFIPAPKVDSTVIRFIPYAKPPVEADEALLMRTIRGAFAQRRKTLLNSLSSEFGEYGKEQLREAVERAGLSPSCRGETLSLEQFAALSRTLQKLDGAL